MNEALLISLSAYADGELDGVARAELEMQLKTNAELRAELHAIRQLDAAAAKLPVPDLAAKLAELVNPVELHTACAEPMPAALRAEIQRVPIVPPERYAQLWKSIAARSVLLEQSDAMKASAIADGELEGVAQPEFAADVALWKRLDAAAAKLPVPELRALAVRESGSDIAVRIRETQRTRNVLSAGAEAQLGVPQISNEKWNTVWKKIESKVAERAPAANVIPLPQRKPSRWRWMTGAAVAAAVLVALLLRFYAPVDTPPEDGIALDLPKPVDDRYDITVEYVKGAPVVCYYLKPEARGGDANRDWRWLPD